LILSTRADIPGALYFPQAMHRKLPTGTPPTMRLYGEDDISRRHYAICYVNSNCNAAMREALYAALRLRLGEDLVYAGGLCHGSDGTQGGFRNVTPGVWSSPSLLEVFSNCRAVMAMENMDAPGYITEKIVNAILSGAVPIQWGAKHHVDTFLELNPKAYIAVGDFASVDKAADEISSVVTNPIRLRAMRNEPVSLNLPALVTKFSYGTSVAASRSAFSNLLEPVHAALMNHWHSWSAKYSDSASIRK